MLRRLLQDRFCSNRLIGFIGSRLVVFYKRELASLSELFGAVQLLVPNQQTLILEWESLQALSVIHPRHSHGPTSICLDECWSRRVLAQSLSLASAAWLLAPTAMALPTGYQSVSGDVQFEEAGNTLNVTTGANRAIAQYQQFNVAANETVNFNLPNRQAAILNRVTGGDPAQIMGKLNSNGSVYIVNPAGIVFSPSAQVNVGSLTASTLQTTDTSFQQDQMTFSKQADAAAVVNQGTLTATMGGHVTLIGSVIDNSGVMSAPGGQVNLAVGDSVTMVVGDNLTVAVTVNEAVQEKVTDYTQAIRNSGTLQAEGGEIAVKTKLTQGLYQEAVNNSGVMEANSLDQITGHILVDAGKGTQSVVMNTGRLSVNGTVESPDAGQIEVYGDYIAQKGEIWAESQSGGQGGTIDINSGQGTWLAAGSDTSVSAMGEQGNAGNLFVWSDWETYFENEATIRATGGTVQGDGGFVEVSGKQDVIYRGQAYGGATNGQGGTILIDPENIIISNTGPFDTVTNASPAKGIANEGYTDHSGQTVTFDPRAGGSFNGFSSIWLQANNNITVNDAFDTSMASAGNLVTAVWLELDAKNDIYINAPITTHGASIELIADSDNNNVGMLHVDADVIGNDGAIYLTGAGITGTGSVLAGSRDLTIITDQNNEPITLGSISGAETEVHTLGSNSPITINGNVNFTDDGSTWNSAGIYANYSDVTINGNITSVDDTDVKLISAGFKITDTWLYPDYWAPVYNPNASVTITGSINLVQSASSQFTVCSGTNSVFSNSFFSTPGTYGNIQIYTAGDNQPLNVTTLPSNNYMGLYTFGNNSGINLGAGYTGKGIYAFTQGSNSPITSTGNISDAGSADNSIQLWAEKSNIVITGNLNHTYNGSGDLALVVGQTQMGAIGNAAATISVSGSINITGNANKEITFISGDNSIFSNAFFSSTKTFSSVNLATLGDNAPLTKPTNFTASYYSLSTFGANSSISLPSGHSGAILAAYTYGTNSPITSGGSITESSTLTLQALYSDISITGNLTSTSTSGLVTLNAGFAANGLTVLNPSAGISLSGTLSITTNANKNMWIYTGTNSIFSKPYFNAALTFGNLDFKTGGNNQPIAWPHNLTGKNVTLQTFGTNSPLSITAGRSITSTELLTLKTASVSSDIGSSGQYFNTSALGLAITGGGSAYISETNDVALKASTVGTNLYLTTPGILYADGTVAANRMEITGTSGIQILPEGSLQASGALGALGSETIKLTSNSGYIVMQGGSTALSGSLYAPSGNISLTATNKPIWTQGSSGSQSGAIIAGQGVTVTSGDLMLVGGSGTDSGSLIGGDGDISITTTGNRGSVFYTFTGTNGMMFDTTGATVLAGADNAYNLIGLPFSVSYFWGAATNTVSAVSDGYLWGGNYTGTGYGTGLQMTSVYRNMMSLFGINLNSSSGGQWQYNTSGTQFVLTYANVPVSGLAGTYVNGQIGVMNAGNSLGLANGTLVFSYGQSQNVGSYGSSFFTGVSKLDGSTNYQSLAQVGVGQTSGYTTNTELTTLLAGRTFAFTPSGSNYTVRELFNTPVASAAGLSVVGGSGNNSGVIQGSNSSNITVSTAGVITTTSGAGTSSGQITTGSFGNIALATSSNGNIAMGASVGGSQNTTLSANGTGNITQTAGVVSASSLLTLTSGTGNIGTALNPVQTSTTTLAVTTGGAGNAYLTEADALDLNASSVGGLLSLSLADSLYVQGVLTTGQVTLATTANDASITFNASINSTGAVSLTTHGTGNISRLSGTLTGTTLSLSSTSGDLGTNSSPLYTHVTSVTASTNGLVGVLEQDDINVGASTVGRELWVQSGGNINITGVQTVDVLSLETTPSVTGQINILANINATSSVMALAYDSLSVQADIDGGDAITLQSGGLLTLDQVALPTSLVGGNVSLVSSTGISIQNAGTVVLARGVGNTPLDFDDDGMTTAPAITPGMTITNSATSGTITVMGELASVGTLRANGTSSDITINYTAGPLDLTNVSLTTILGTNGVIQLLSDSNALDNGTLDAQNATGTGAVNMTTAGAFDITGTGMTVSATTLTLTSGGSINLSGDFNTTPIDASSVTSLSLTDTASDLDLGTLSAATTLTLTTTSGALTFDNLTSTGGGDIVLSSASTINDTDDVGDNILTTGTLSLTSNGAIGDSSTLNINTGDVSVLSLGGNTLHLSDSGVLTLGNITTGGSGSLHLISAGSITHTGSFTSAGSVTLASNGAITLTNLSVGQLNVTSTGGNSVSCTSLSDLALGTINATGGNVTMNSAGSILLQGLVQGAAVSLTAAQSILDTNGSGLSLSATQGASLYASGVIGTLSAPLDVWVTGGALSVYAQGRQNRVSVDINGTVSPANTLFRQNNPPGLVIFNGLVIYPIYTTSLAVATAIITGEELGANAMRMPPEEFRRMTSPSNMLWNALENKVMMPDSDWVSRQYVVPRQEDAKVVFQAERAYAAEALNGLSDDELEHLLAPEKQP